jgi:hypothetical protein
MTLHLSNLLLALPALCAAGGVGLLSHAGLGLAGDIVTGLRHRWGLNAGGTGHPPQQRRSAHRGLGRTTHRQLVLPHLQAEDQRQVTYRFQIT